MWCYLVTACFDWKIGVSQQTVVTVYYILNYISNDTQMVSWSFDVCGITTTDPSKIRSGSFYKTCMENASKHLKNNEKEDDLFVLWFYTVISLRSLRNKEKQKLQKLFFYFWVIENI